VASFRTPCIAREQAKVSLDLRADLGDEDGVAGEDLTGMLYLIIVALLAVVPLCLGYRMGPRLTDGGSSKRRYRSTIPVVAALAWFALAYGARLYADTDRPGWACAEWFAHSGKWYVFSAMALFFLGIALGSRLFGRARIVAALLAEIFLIWLLVWRTMPSYAWLPRQDTRDDNGHLRQSIERTCGPVALANLLEVLLKKPAPSERQLARLCHTTVEGTPLAGLIAAAGELGLELRACKRMDLAELRGHAAPAIVLITTLPTVRHATVLLRIDGDQVYFIDPAYGYSTIAAKDFEENWYGKTLVFDVAGQ